MSRTLALLLLIGVACLAASAAGEKLFALLTFSLRLCSHCLSVLRPASHARLRCYVRSLSSAFGPLYPSPSLFTQAVACRPSGVVPARRCNADHTSAAVTLHAAVTVHAGAGDKVTPSAAKAPAPTKPAAATASSGQKAVDAKKVLAKTADLASDGPLAGANCTAQLCIGTGPEEDCKYFNYFDHEFVVRQRFRDDPKVHQQRCNTCMPSSSCPGSGATLLGQPAVWWPTKLDWAAETAASPT